MKRLFFSSSSHRGDVTVWRNDCLESSSLESEGDTEDGEDTDGGEKDTHSHLQSSFQTGLTSTSGTTEPTIKLILDIVTNPRDLLVEFRAGRGRRRSVGRGEAAAEQRGGRRRGGLLLDALHSPVSGGLWRAEDTTACRHEEEMRRGRWREECDSFSASKEQHMD